MERLVEPADARRARVAAPTRCTCTGTRASSWPNAGFGRYVVCRHVDDRPVDDEVAPRVRGLVRGEKSRRQRHVVVAEDHEVAARRARRRDCAPFRGWARLRRGTEADTSRARRPPRRPASCRRSSRYRPRSPRKTALRLAPRATRARARRSAARSLVAITTEIRISARKTRSDAKAIQPCGPRRPT